MVLWYNSNHDYNFPFETVTIALFNKYPNPYSRHVESVDTIHREIINLNKIDQLKTIRLIKKNGKLPKWVSPFLGKISHSWVYELTIIDPINKEMKCYQRNLDHTRIIRIEEYTNYKSIDDNMTRVNYRVKFSSGFQKKIGINSKIEDWSHSKFIENISNTKNGMSYVMKKCQETLSFKRNEKI
ncbi:hypothetical protein WICMUC_000288 [Wickerhamomyces mucosus]|uniref:PRELI/MSF1 domain-containing protein n=1 Tax=Wickerhamomyces mucosus TaxID=1378264 RepID=A0A9P8PZN1_9ASCO|nr:hypothetical protein WICMUC_000288 [Wickerhamomyces mucosus]